MSLSVHAEGLTGTIEIVAFDRFDNRCIAVRSSGA